MSLRTAGATQGAMGMDAAMDHDAAAGHDPAALAADEERLSRILCEVASQRDPDVAKADVFTA